MPTSSTRLGLGPIERSEPVLAIDIGASRIRAAVVEQATLRIIGFSEAPTPQSPDPEAIPSSVVGLVKGLVGLDRVRRAGMASIGPIDSRRGVIELAPNVAGRPRSIPVAEVLKRELGLEEVYMANDCNAAAYAEYLARPGRERHDLLYVTVSTGIGGGAVVEGRPVLGLRGNAAEIGHCVIDPSGYMRCGCGGRGHWEAYCSGRNIPEYARRLAEGGEIPTGSRLHHLVLREGTGPHEIFELYRAGDPPSRPFFVRLATLMAAGLSTAINLFAPDVLVTGGAVYLGNEDFFRAEVFPRLRDFLMLDEPRIEGPIYGEHSPLMGAALLVANRVGAARVEL
jgi:glucokinase